MENATKALMIAAGVLMGVLIMSLVTSLYMMFGGYAKDTEADIEASKIQQFNEQFLKYSNKEDANGNGTLTIQDVVSARNAALDSNLKYDNYNTSIRATENNYYVDVYFYRQNKKDTIFNNDITQLLNDYIGVKDIKCQVTISPKTGRVYKVVFQ